MTYLTPNVNSSGRFSGDLAAGDPDRRLGRLVGHGDYIKGVQTLGYTTDLLLAGVRDFPAQMGAGSSTSNFTAEAKFGTDWLLRMWDDTTRTFYYQVGIGTGNAKTVGDHDIWRLPQADDTFGGTDPATATSATARSSRAGPPGRSSARSGRPQRRGLRPVLPGLQDHRSGLRQPLPAGGPAHLRPRQHRTYRESDHLHPVQLLPRDRVAQRLGARRPSSTWRWQAAGFRPGFPTPIRVSTCSRRRTGPTPTSPARMTPPTR